MQRVIAAVVVVVAVLAGPPRAAAANELVGAARLGRAIAGELQPRHAADVVITGISDGDTATAEIDGKSVRLRLARIDAPERKQPWGNRSEQSLRELVWKKLVHIEWREVDRNGRPIVTMAVDGRDVSAEQVRRGMAWVYREYSLDPNLLMLEDLARQGRIGLWADPVPLPPWQWRRMKREGELDGLPPRGQMPQSTTKEERHGADERCGRVAQAGELLVRAAPALGTLSSRDRSTLDELTDGQLCGCIRLALESASMVSLSVENSLRANPPKGFSVDVEVG